MGSLYDALQLAAATHSKAQSTVRDVQAGLRNYNSLCTQLDSGHPQASLELPVPPVTPQYRDILEHWRGSNRLVEDAMDGRRTVLETYLKLANINHGVKRFLPRRKDPRHNTAVEELGAVIGEDAVEHLVTRGIFARDNAVAGLVGGGTITAAVYFALIPLVEYQIPSVPIRDPLLAGFVGLAGMGIVAGPTAADYHRVWRSKRHEKNARQKARFVDDAIDEVIRKP